MQYKLLIIIPCYNEAASIANLLQELLQLNLPNGFDATIAVINDCSKDDTAKVVSTFPVVLLDLPVNLGIGGAMQTGYKYAFDNNFDFAVQMDGDGQHPPSQLYKLLERWQHTNADIIIGSRFLQKEGFQSSALRRGGIKYLYWLNKQLTGKEIKDCTSGFRMFNKTAIAVVANNYPDEYPEPESLVIFSKNNFSIKEVAVVMKERQGGQSSIRRFSQLYYMVKVTIAMCFSYIRK